MLRMLPEIPDGFDSWTEVERVDYLKSKMDGLDDRGAISILHMMKHGFSDTPITGKPLPGFSQ